MSAERVTIVGQGIAGSMLAWACERAGRDFVIFDGGHAQAASRVGAGLVSPLTGRRLVPTWRFADWREAALEIYRTLERELGIPLVREMRLRRLYRDEAERARFLERLDVVEVRPWIDAVDDHGLWMLGALQVDTAALIAALRARWLQQGRLIERPVDAPEGPTVWCTGAASATRIDLGGGGRWELSKGELLRGRLPGLAPDVVLNDGQWILPLGGGEVRVGATFARDDLELVVTAKSQTLLHAAAERLGPAPLTDGEGLVGLRVTLPDRRPVAGWLDTERRRGVLGALAAKGALWAPVLAAQWLADDMAGEQIDAEARAGRFGWPSA